jgi:hypothetical protein
MPGDEALTSWMRDNLSIGAVVRDDPGDIEPLLIKHQKPLLCLTGWDNPHRAHIKAMRKACKEEAAQDA